MTVGNFNYTDRREIKNKSVTLNITERTDEFVRVKVGIDLKKIHTPASSVIVLDAFERGGNYQRQYLEPTPEQETDFNGFIKDSKLSFKLKIVSKDDTDIGRVVSATSEIHPKEPKSTKKREEFFVPVQEDLGDMPWLIEWEGDDGNPIVKINTRLIEKFGEWHNPTLQAMFLPVIFRDLLSGIISRTDKINDVDDKESLTYRLLHFCKDRLGQSFPEEDVIDDGCINTLWLDWIEESIKEFCGTRWRHNKTLMEQMLEGIKNG